MSFISGQNLTCIRGYTPIFRALSFAVNTGETLLLCGDNGCGKTTLLRMIAGLLEPANGEINGTNPSDIFWLAQELPLKSALSVKQNLDFLAALYGMTAPSAPDLAPFGLAQIADYPVHYLSSGQKRRMMLALLAQSPRKIWLLDEPTNHLDHAGIELLQSTLKSHSHKSGIAIIATHAPEHFTSLAPATHILNVAAFSPDAPYESEAA